MNPYQPPFGDARLERAARALTVLVWPVIIVVSVVLLLDVLQRWWPKL